MTDSREDIQKRVSEAFLEITGVDPKRVRADSVNLTVMPGMSQQVLTWDGFMIVESDQAAKLLTAARASETVKVETKQATVSEALVDKVAQIAAQSRRGVTAKVNEADRQQARDVVGFLMPHNALLEWAKSKNLS